MTSPRPPRAEIEVQLQELLLELVHVQYKLRGAGAKGRTITEQVTDLVDEVRDLRVKVRKR